MATFATRPPTIVLNTPGAATSTISAPRPALPVIYNDRATSTPSIPTTSSTTTKPTNPAPINTANTYSTRPKRSSSIRSTTPSLNNPTNDPSCYLCDEQNPGDFSPTLKHLETCQLCTRIFCRIHKSSTYDQICNINHSKYYHEMFDNAMHTVSENQEWLSEEDGMRMREMAEEMLVEEGIYPSLGERQKAIFATSPVDPDRQQQIEQFRSLNSQIRAGHAGRGDSVRQKGLVEEVDVIGADIAV